MIQFSHSGWLLLVDGHYNASIATCNSESAIVLPTTVTVSLTDQLLGLDFRIMTHYCTEYMITWFAISLSNWWHCVYIKKIKDGKIFSPVNFKLRLPDTSEEMKDLTGAFKWEAQSFGVSFTHLKW